MPSSQPNLAATELSPHAVNFIESVMALKPRIAVFDCDGTLWSGDGGQDFLYWEIENQIIPHKVAEWAAPRYASYKQGKVGEEQMCGEMVTIHAGLDVKMLQDATERFFAQLLERRIFPEMQELTRRLLEAGCQLWAVSSTNEWVIKAGVRRFGIPEEHVLAAAVEVSQGLATDKLLRVPTDEHKASAIRQFIPKKVDAIFGNSMHDAAMLEIAGHAFAVNPNPDLEEIARKRGWSVYRPDGT